MVKYNESYEQILSMIEMDVFTSNTLFYLPFQLLLGAV